MTQNRTRAKRPDTYDPSVLSEEEKERFLAALEDGFGYHSRREHLGEAALPGEVEPGLLMHRAHYDKNCRYEEGEFWEESDGDSPPGLFEQCPINFQLPAIRKYFQEQKAAYLAYAKSPDDYTRCDGLKPEERSSWEEHWDERIYSQVLYETYSKPWYEYHINEHIYFLDESVAMLGRSAKQGQKLGLDVMLILNFSGKLNCLQGLAPFNSPLVGERTQNSAGSGGYRVYGDNILARKQNPNGGVNLALGSSFFGDMCCQRKNGTVEAVL